MHTSLRFKFVCVYSAWCLRNWGKTASVTAQKTKRTDSKDIDRKVYQFGWPLVVAAIGERYMVFIAKKRKKEKRERKGEKEERRKERKWGQHPIFHWPVKAFPSWMYFLPSKHMKLLKIFSGKHANWRFVLHYFHFKLNVTSCWPSLVG